MNKFIRGGSVAVLVSKGFGAGWSSWNSYPDMVFDPDIVQMVLDGKDTDEIRSVAKRKWPGAYLGGADGLCVLWIPIGSKIYIEDHDGAETLSYPDNDNWIEA